MRPLSTSCFIPPVLALLLLCSTIPGVASSQALAPEMPGRLVHAAADIRLLPWQRDYMLRLARRGEGSSLDTVPAQDRAARTERTLGATDGVWTNNVLSGPGRRTDHVAIHDPVRQRMLVLGGNDGPNFVNDVWALSLARTPEWTEITPTGTPSDGRIGESAVYDPARDRVVVFGGVDFLGVTHNDVWALSLAGTPAWTELTPTGSLPSTRSGHSAIYDPTCDRMLVFGGVNAGHLYFDDVWALSLSDPPAWTALAPTGSPPSARAGHSAIHDPACDRMIVFAGAVPTPSPGVTPPRNDVWALSLSGTPVWTELIPSGMPPSAREGHRAIYDPVRFRMVVFAGSFEQEREPPARLNDVWALSLVGTPVWTEITPTGTPPVAALGRSAIYEAVHDRLLVFGGASSTVLGEFNHVWALSLAATSEWTKFIPTGPLPGARYTHSAIHDPVRDRMLVFGGTAADYLNDVWALSLAGTPVWTEITPTGTPPSARGSHSAIYDPVRDRMLVFGGFGSLRDLNDVWTLSLADTPEWTEITATGTPPSARSSHNAIYDPVSDRMVVFGGSDATGLVNDVWALTLSGTPAWTAITPTGTPPSARNHAGTIYDPARGRMLVFGGWDELGTRNDVWALSLAGTPAWTSLAPSGTPPSARYLHSVIHDSVRDRLVVFGGHDGVGYRNDVWALSLAGTPAWSVLTPDGTLPNVRALHSAIQDPVRDRMVVFGGGKYPAYVNEVWMFWPAGVLGVGDPGAQPSTNLLYPAFPNPTRGATTVNFSLAKPGRVRIGVYDVHGRLVRVLLDALSGAGGERVEWDGADESGARLAAGAYFIRLVSPGTLTTQRVIVLR